MRRSWSSAFIFNWTPILTFARRRIEFLDWLEKHTEPVAFNDDGATVGVALASRDMRVTVARSHLHVDFANHISPAESLLPALEGVFEVLEPRDLTLRNAHLVQTRSLDGIAYDEARAQFARRVSLATLPGELRAIDASTIMDIQGPEWSGQIEWGVVNQREILDRLTDPKLGRLRGDKGSSRPRVSPVVHSDIADQPEASVLVDSVLRRRVGGSADSAHQVLARIDEVEELVGTLTDQISEPFTEGGSDELAQA